MNHKLLIHKRRLKNDTLYNAISGSIKGCINVHGDITKENIGMITKRITGDIKTIAVNEIIKIINDCIESKIKITIDLENNQQ